MQFLAPLTKKRKLSKRIHDAARAAKAQIQLTEFLPSRPCVKITLYADVHIRLCGQHCVDVFRLAYGVLHRLGENSVLWFELKLSCQKPLAI